MPALLLALGVLLLAACGNDGPQGSPEPIAETMGDSDSTLSLSASATRAAPGETVTLMWHSSGLSQCQGLGAWDGPLPERGTRRVVVDRAETTYRIQCRRRGRVVADAVTLTPIDPEALAVTLTADETLVTAGAAATLRWQADDAALCTAGGDWQGDRPVSGRERIDDLRATSTFTLSCSAGNNQALATVTVTVEADEVLRWRAPTAHTDGRPLQTLSGYRIYWGARSEAYTGSVTLTDPAITEWAIEAPAGTWFFAMTALDEDGTESGFSNEVRKTVSDGAGAAVAAVLKSPPTTLYTRKRNDKAPPTITPG